MKDYIVIPASVRFNKNLIASTKLFYGDILANCDSNYVCNLTNKELAKLANCSLKSINCILRQRLYQYRSYLQRRLEGSNRANYNYFERLKMLEKKGATKTASLSKTVLVALFNKQFCIIAKKVKGKLK